MYAIQHTMSSPWKHQPEAVADKVLKRAELSKVWHSAKQHPISAR
jgi:hypothetical protein